MTAPAAPPLADLIAELRRLDKEATPAPWRAETEALTLTDAGRRLGLEGKEPARETTIHTTYIGMAGMPTPVVTVATTPFWDPGRFVYIRPEDAAAMVAARNALPRLLSAAERAEGLATALAAVTEGMDASGGDPDGMPECPWCHSDGSYHDADCDLIRARAALAAYRGSAP